MLTTASQHMDPRRGTTLLLVRLGTELRGVPAAEMCFLRVGLRILRSLETTRVHQAYEPKQSRPAESVHWQSLGKLLHPTHMAIRAEHQQLQQDAAVLGSDDLDFSKTGGEGSLVSWISHAIGSVPMLCVRLVVVLVQLTACAPGWFGLAVIKAAWITG